MRIPGADQAIGNLVKWSLKDEWELYRAEVFADHFTLVKEKLGVSVDEALEAVGEAADMVFGFILEDFFAARFGEDGELNVVDDYLKRRGWREKPSGKRYLQALRDSVASVYEVVDLDPGRTMTVRDLILGGDPVTLEEKLGSESAARWDRIAGRVVTVNGKPYFTGGLLVLPHRVADKILAAVDEAVKQLKRDQRKAARKQGASADIDDRKVRELLLSDSIFCRLFTQAWLIDALRRARGPRPEVRNTDGEQILFSEARFPIVGDEAEVAAVLDGIAELDRDDPADLRWAWHGEGSPTRRMSGGSRRGSTLQSEDEAGLTLLGDIKISDGALVLGTNSRERAERGWDLLAAHLGTLVGPPLIAHQDLDRAIEERSGSTPPRDSGPPPEVAEQVVREYLDDHYLRTLDDPLPALDGKTPRQAVKTKKGRRQVVDWLKYLENSEFRRAAHQGHKPYDMAWMWRELKIDETQ
jgi:hypothetical protein